MFCSSKGAVRKGFLIQVLFICQQCTEGPGRLCREMGFLPLVVSDQLCCYHSDQLLAAGFLLSLCMVLFVFSRHKWDLLPILVFL